MVILFLSILCSISRSLLSSHTLRPRPKGCTSEGVDLTLTGRNPIIQCVTRGLDHKDREDFTFSANFDANREEPHENGWGSCHKV